MDIGILWFPVKGWGRERGSVCMCCGVVCTGQKSIASCRAFWLVWSGWCIAASVVVPLSLVILRINQSLELINP